MSQDRCVLAANGGGTAWDMVPLLEEKEFAGYAVDAVRGRGLRVMAFFAVPEPTGYRIVSVLGDPNRHILEISSFGCGDRYRSLTPEIPALRYFEGEIAETCGILPEGCDRAIPPEHRRGIEKMLKGGPDRRSIHFMETASGDSSVAAACAYSLAVEALADCRVPKATARLRAIALELERLANHTGVFGVLAGDAALPSIAALCGRIRGEYLNTTAGICGNRFGRGIVRPGTSGVTFDAAAAGAAAGILKRVFPELDGALQTMLEAPALLNRLRAAGTVTNSRVAEQGCVGVAARASAVKCDARLDFPADGVDYGGFLPHPAFSPEYTGDGVSAARVRRFEISASHYWLMYALTKEPEPVASASRLLEPGLLGGMIGVGIVESWRGEYVCVCLSDGEGRFRKVEAADPSFHNGNLPVRPAAERIFKEDGPCSKN